MYESLQDHNVTHKQHATAKYLRRQKALRCQDKKRGQKYRKHLILQNDSANEHVSEDDIPVEPENNTPTCPCDGRLPSSSKSLVLWVCSPTEEAVGAAVALLH
jgi:hypothetical protein